MQGSAQLQGADNLVRTLRSAAEDLESMTEAERAAGDLLATDVRDNSPVLTGYMVSTVAVELVSTGLEVTVAADDAAATDARTQWFTDTVAGDEQKVTDIYEAGVETALAQVEGI